MSSLPCTLFGHKFQNPESVETDQEQNQGQNHSVTVQKTRRRCSRCGETSTHKERTSVRSAEQDNTSDENSDEDSDKQTQTDTQNTQQPFEQANTDTEEGRRTEPVDSGSLDSPGLATETVSEERDMEDDKGVMILKDELPQDDDDTANTDDDADSQKETIMCESCGFGRNVNESSHRSGDICPDCGSWLSVGV